MTGVFKITGERLNIWNCLKRKREKLAELYKTLRYVTITILVKGDWKEKSELQNGDFKGIEDANCESQSEMGHYIQAVLKLMTKQPQLFK